MNLNTQMDPSWSKYCLLPLFLAIILSIQPRRRRHHLRPYPPGPPGLPVLGNFLDVPRTAPWTQFAKWGKKYGPVIYLNLLGRPLVVLNTAKATIDLLERRSNKYADRPKFTMAGDIVGYKNMMIMSSYGHVCREQRKLISGTFGKNRVVHLHEGLETFASQLARSMFDDPDNMSEIIRQHIGNFLLSTIYGFDAREEYTHHIATASQCGIEFPGLTLPGNFLVDSLPFLRHVPSWVPLSPQRQARNWRETAAKVRTLPYDEAKRRIDDGITKRSFLSQVFTRQGALEMEKELEFSMITAILLIAGSDTVSDSPLDFGCCDALGPKIGMAIRSAIFSLMRYQDAQFKGQAEIDKIVGPGRLPTLKDKESLPYVTAFCREILRLHVPAPLGFVHAASSDDVYEGHHIPAGAMVVSNIWEILHDPQNYPDPWKFNPDRFIGKIDAGIDLVELGFGFGRRQCPGKYLTFDLLFITVATLMAVFDIRPSRPIEPSDSPSGIAIRAESLNCIMTYRISDTAMESTFLASTPLVRRHTGTVLYREAS